MPGPGGGGRSGHPRRHPAHPGGRRLAGHRGRERAAILTLAADLACHFLLLKPLGAMLAFGAIAKWFSDSLAFDAANARLRQMEDARIENDFYLEAYRDRNGLE